MISSKVEKSLVSVVWYRGKLSFFATDSYQILSSLAKDKPRDSTECMKLSSYAKKLGIHYNTAYRMFRRGQIAGYQLPTGTVIIEEPVVQTMIAPPRSRFIA